MQFNCKSIIIVPNKDGTYKIELINCLFKDNNEEDIRGVVTFPRVSKDGIDSFKNENFLTKSEIFSVIIPEQYMDKASVF